MRTFFLQLQIFTHSVFTNSSRTVKTRKCKRRLRPAALSPSKIQIARTAVVSFDLVSRNARNTIFASANERNQEFAVRAIDYCQRGNDLSYDSNDLRHSRSREEGIYCNLLRTHIREMTYDTSRVNRKDGICVIRVTYRDDTNRVEIFPLISIFNPTFILLPLSS